MRELPHLRDFHALLPELNKESDRGLTLISCSFIDEQLAATIGSFLLQGRPLKRLLSGFNAPLASFSSRIAMARALGLISEREHDECEILRKIRNEFAHRVHCSFDEPKIVALCAKLTMDAKPYERDDGTVVLVNPRGAFVSSATGVILNLVNRPHYVSLEKLGEHDWRY